MSVDIDQSGCDIEPGNIHRFTGLPRGNVLHDPRNPVAVHRYVHDAVNPIGGIDHVAALEQRS